MNLSSMFLVAKQINSYNRDLNKYLPAPFNQLTLVKIVDNNAVFVAKNQTILNICKQQSDIIINCLINDLGLNVEGIEIKLIFES